MAEGRAKGFPKLCRNTLFNPPRYLKASRNHPDREDRFQKWLNFRCTTVTVLGKRLYYAKDTPAFIGNRVGVYGLLESYRLDAQVRSELWARVDKLPTGYRSAKVGNVPNIRRLSDWDTLVKVTNNFIRRPAETIPRMFPSSRKVVVGWAKQMARDKPVGVL